MTLADRLMTAMRHRKISQAELARACGVRPPSVSGWLSGKARFLRGENLLAAADALGVSEQWLATGEGEMLATRTKGKKEVVDWILSLEDAEAALAYETAKASVLAYRSAIRKAGK